MDTTSFEGFTLYQMGKYAQALTTLLSVTPATPAESLNVAYYIGLTYMQLKRYEDALVYLEQVVTEGTVIERIRQCRLLLAVIYSLTGRENLADFELRKLFDAGYRTASVYSAFAYIAWEQEKPEESVRYYEKALEEEPEHISALNGLGYVLACMGRDVTRALGLCKKAVELAPNSPACLDSLGWVYYKMGLTHEAKQYIKKAKERAGEDKEISEHFAVVIADEKLIAAHGKLADAGDARAKA